MRVIVLERYSKSYKGLDEYELEGCIYFNKGMEFFGKRTIQLFVAIH